MNTVLAHTSGLAAMAPIFEATKFAPAAGVSAGCSDWPAPGISHDTAGSRSCSASYSNCPVATGAMPLSCKGVPGVASWNCLKCGSMLYALCPTASAYTFQLTPAASSRSAYVVHVYGPFGNEFDVIGPPCWPPG